MPPSGSRRRRRGMPPSPLGPSGGSAFPGTDDGDDAAAVSEHPCVTLEEWWLDTVKGADQKEKIAVAGRFRRNQTLEEYSPAPIVKRLEPSVLETEAGAVLLIHGSHIVSQTFDNGYSQTVCEKFLHGFPEWWEGCKVMYPKLMNTDVDSTQFYLGQFELGNRLLSECANFLECSSRKNAVFQKSSHLLNGKPRFEEYTSDDDIAVDENAAASSKAATGDQRTPVVSLEVRGCYKEIQHMSLTEKAAGDAEMPTSVYLDMHGDIPTNGDAAASNDDNERNTATSKEVNNMEIGLVMGSPSRERGHDDIATNVSLALAVEHTNNAVSESVHSTPAMGTYRKRTQVASLKSQGSRQNQHIASNKKAHRSPPTHGKDTLLSMTTVEALNLKRSRSGRVIVPKLDEGCQSIAYGSDGSITGVNGAIGVNGLAPGLLKWSGSKTARRKKKTRSIRTRQRKLELT